MAKMKNKKNSSRDESAGSSRSASAQSSRGRFEAGSDAEFEDTDVEEDTEESNYQAAGSRQSGGQSRQNSPATRNAGGNREQSKSQKSFGDFDPKEVLDSARDFMEGNPVRATLIGALVGGAVAGLFATERGRSLVTSAYAYARPMIADYARNFINAQSDRAVDAALPQ